MLEAAETLSRASASDQGISSVIESLTDRSLLRVDPSLTGNGAPRPTMLETVHEFATEKLAATGDEEPRRRHAEYFTELATRVERGLWFDDYARWSCLIGPERANLRAALDWSLQQGDTDASLRLAIAMYSPAWLSDAYSHESDQVLKLALDLPGGSPAARVAALVISAWVAPTHFDSAEAEALGGVPTPARPQQSVPLTGAYPSLDGQTRARPPLSLRASNAPRHGSSSGSGWPADSRFDARARLPAGALPAWRDPRRRADRREPGARRDRAQGSRAQGG